MRILGGGVGATKGPISFGSFDPGGGIVAGMDASSLVVSGVVIGGGGDRTLLGGV
jgi:hypothetical protein